MALKKMIFILALVACTSAQKESISYTYINCHSVISEKSLYNFNELPDSNKNFTINERLLKFKEQIKVDAIFAFDLEYSHYKDTTYIFNIQKINNGDIKGGEKLPILIFCNGEMTKKEFTYPTGISPYSRNILDFSINDKYCLVLISSTLYIYDKYNFSLVKKIPLEKYANKITRFNGNIYLISSTFGICTGFTITPTISKVDMEKLEVVNTVEFSMPKGGNMTYLGPKRVLGVWGKGYYISDISDYHIKFYTFDCKLHSEINYTPKKWIHSDKIAKSIDSSKNFDLFRSRINSLEAMSFVECIDFINDTTFLLQRSDSNRINHIYDIWEYSENVWKLKYADLNSKYEYDKIIGDNYIADYWYNYSFIGNNIFSIFSVSPFDMMKDSEIKKLTYRKLLDRINDYYLDNPQKISLNIYDFLEEK